MLTTVFVLLRSIGLMRRGHRAVRSRISRSVCSLAFWCVRLNLIQREPSGRRTTGILAREGELPEQPALTHPQPPKSALNLPKPKCVSVAHRGESPVP